MSSVWGFFYGGLINPEIMARVGLTPRSRETATLSGYELRIAPLVNLYPQPECIVHGLLLNVTHRELHHVYSQLKAIYLPYPVLTVTPDGKFRPALCYIVPNMAEGQAEADHVMALLRPAEALGFPESYLARIRSFLPPAASS